MPTDLDVVGQRLVTTVQSRSFTHDIRVGANSHQILSRVDQLIKAALMLTDFCLQLLHYHDNRYEEVKMQIKLENMVL